jgi:hypothetical protein
MKDTQPANRFRWTHFGNKETYFALQEPKDPEQFKKLQQAYANIGINHLAIIIDDLELKTKLINENG